MKLNNKGYMLIEIIFASVLAVSIAYYLLDLTYKFKNTDEDIYQSIEYLNDKNMITKNIMNDLQRGSITEFVQENDSVKFVLRIEEDSSVVLEERRLEILESDDGIWLYYGLYQNGAYVTSDKSYYERTFSSALIVGDIEMNLEENSVNIVIPMSTMYGDIDYNIKLYAALFERWT